METDSIHGEETPPVNSSTPTPNGVEASVPTEVPPTVVEQQADLITSTMRKPRAKATKAVKAQRRARYQETGHAINFRNFGIIIQSVIGLGANYITPNVLLVLTHLQTVYASCEEALNKVAEKLVAYRYAVKEQSLVFGDLKTTCTMAYNAFKACGVDKETVTLLRLYRDKIQGTRVVKIDPENEDKDYISASQQSHAQQIQFFNLFINVLAGEPLYQPGNPAVTVDGLETKLEAMKATAYEVSVTSMACSNARTERDIIMYKIGTGMIDLAYGVKDTYVSLFGFNSPYHKQIKSLEFRRQGDYKNL